MGKKKGKKGPQDNYEWPDSDEGGGTGKPDAMEAGSALDSAGERADEGSRGAQAVTAVDQEPPAGKKKGGRRAERRSEDRESDGPPERGSDDHDRVPSRKKGGRRVERGSEDLEELSLRDPPEAHGRPGSSRGKQKGERRAERGSEDQKRGDGEAERSSEEHERAGSACGKQKKKGQYKPNHHLYQAQPAQCQAGPAARPGKLGFEGVEDGGRAQSLFRGMSSGARAALRKKLQRGQPRPKEPGEGAVEAPPTGVPHIDALCQLHRVLERARCRTVAAFVAKCAQEATLDPPLPPSLQGCVAAFCDAASLDPLVGSPLYRCWEHILAPGGAEARAPSAPEPEEGPREVDGAADVAAEEAGREEGEEGEAEAGESASGGPVVAAAQVEVWSAFGLRPAEAGYLSDDVYNRIAACVRDETLRCVAVGVVGLDYSRDDSLAAREVQVATLRRMCELVAATGRAMIVECRGGPDAFADLQALLLRFLPREARVLLHDCAGGAEAAAVLGLMREFPGMCLGFTGSLTYAKAKPMHELAFDCPMDRLILETGAPEHLPSSLGGGRRSYWHSGQLTLVAAEVVKQKGPRASLDAVVEASARNVRRLYRLSLRTEPEPGA